MCLIPTRVSSTPTRIFFDVESGSGLSFEFLIVIDIVLVWHITVRIRCYRFDDGENEFREGKNLWYNSTCSGTEESFSAAEEICRSFCRRLLLRVERKEQFKDMEKQLIPELVQNWFEVTISTSHISADKMLFSMTYFLLLLSL